VNTPPDEPGARPPAERGEWEQVQFRKPEEIDRPVDPANAVGKVLIAFGAVIVFGPFLLMGTCAVIVAIIDR
jgi:hypothetical protein